MSFNCRGFTRAHKKYSLKRVVSIEHPDFLLLQETLGTREEVKARMENLLPRWSFTTVDALGRSGGLAIGWNSQKIQVLNTWGLDSSIGITFLLPTLKETVHLLNIYGPYMNRKPLSNTLLNKSFFKDLLILGGI